MLFEPVDPITTMAIKRSIENTISLHEPRIALEEVVVFPFEDEVLESLRRLPSFTVEQKHWFSHARMIDPARINEDEVVGLLNW